MHCLITSLKQHCFFYTPPSSKESAVLFFDYWADGHHQFSPPLPKVELEDHSPCGDFQINCQSKSLPRADWDVVILAKMYLIAQGNTLCFGRGAITLLPRGGNAEAWKPRLTWK